MSVNLNAYVSELRAVGLPGDCAEDGRVDFTDGTSWKPGQKVKTAQEQIAATVFAAHNKIAANLQEQNDKNNELLIQQELREMAIERLKVKGKWNGL